MSWTAVGGDDMRPTGVCLDCGEFLEDCVCCIYCGLPECYGYACVFDELDSSMFTEEEDDSDE